MAKLGTRAPLPPSGAIKTISSSPSAPDAVTFEGGAGWTRDPKSELFLLAVTNLVSEDTFYEKAGARDERFESLVAQVAATDPDWIARFVPYLRTSMNMRSASIVMAAELVHARLELAKSRAGGWTTTADNAALAVGTRTNRSIIDSAIWRADEPGEMIGYWRSRFGKALPMPVKRGIADAVVRLYNERSFIKYGAGDGYRMADVIELVHPEPKAPWQGELFKHVIDDRHGHAGKVYGAVVEAEMLPAEPLLPVILANATAMAMTPEVFRAAFTSDFVEKSGLTWEQASSRYGKLDSAFWDAMIPNMGIFAVVRNLRNFDEAGISAESKKLVIDKLTDAETIAKSRMFPLRFYSAWANTGTMTWGAALDEAIGHSLQNVPSLPGRTLILVDTSGSMAVPLSGRSTAQRWQVAALFGAALALRAEKATLVSFQSDSREILHHKVGSALRIVDEIKNDVGGGTNTWQAVSKHYDSHDRVIIITDEQAGASSGYGYGSSFLSGRPEAVGTTKPLYTFNLAGYKVSHAPTGDKRYAFGGLSDGAFVALSLLERGNDASWPFDA